MDVAVFGVFPYVLNGPGNTKSGVDIEITEMLAKTFGFSYRLVPTKGWGHFDKETGRWRGTVGKVQKIVRSQQK